MGCEERVTQYFLFPMLRAFFDLLFFTYSRLLFISCGGYQFRVYLFTPVKLSEHWGQGL